VGKSDNFEHPINEDEPQTGYYRVTVRVEGSGWVSVPARIWLISGDRDENGDLLEDEVFGAEIGNTEVDIWWFWPWKANKKITKDEWLALDRWLEFEQTQKWINMKMPDNEGGSFALPPEGTHPARCYRIVDLGTQQVDWQGTIKHQRKIMVAWELPNEKMDDGRPFSISKRYTLSSHEKSNLRKDLESWRGKKFEDNEFGDQTGFDLAKLLGVPCLLTVVHNNGYANIMSVTAPPSGYDVPELLNETYIFSLDDFDEIVFMGLSDRLKETIRKSPEYAQTTGIPDDSYESSGQGGGSAEISDEIPF